MIHNQYMIELKTAFMATTSFKRPKLAYRAMSKTYSWPNDPQMPLSFRNQYWLMLFEDKGRLWYSCKWKSESVHVFTEDASITECAENMPCPLYKSVQNGINYTWNALASDHLYIEHYD